MKTAISHSPLSLQVADNVRQRIHDQELEPGRRLDEQELAHELGVSRTPVREALRLLAAEGLVAIRERRGCFVAELTPKDQEEIFPIMARLEGWVAHEVAEKATPEQLARLDALHASLERFAAAGDVNRYYGANHTFHISLQEMVGNRWLQDVLGELRAMLSLSRHRSLTVPGRIDSSIAEHRQLMDALHRRDADRAEELMRNHLLRQLDALRQLHRQATERPPAPT